MPEPRKRMEPKKPVERKPEKSGMRDYYAGAMADQYEFTDPKKRGEFIALLINGVSIDRAVEKTGAEKR